MNSAFPELSDDQVDAIRPFAKEVDLPAGSILFERGDRRVDFWVVLRGSIEIFDQEPCGGERIFTVHHPGHFTGELHLFNDRKILLSGRTGEASRLLRVKRNEFHYLLNAEPELAQVLLRAFVMRRSDLIHNEQGGVVVIGPDHDRETARIRQFLIRNGYPHRWRLPTDRVESGATLEAELGLKVSDLPLVWESRSRLFKRPTNADLARELGMAEDLPEGHLFDVAIVGAGPAGLAAAVYAASEGLDTVLIDAIAPGGQAGTSSRIENYLGFPNGLSGQDLASRAMIQAYKFGVHMVVSRQMTGVLREPDGSFRLLADDGVTLRARTVIVASGAKYRKLDLPECDQFEGRGVHYAATAMESQLCVGEEVIVVGGGNSAGQAALYLSRSASCAHLFVRSGGLASSMSDYLVQRLKASPRVRIHFKAEITRLEGNASLERVEWSAPGDGGTKAESIGNVFVMIGADPNTSWVKGTLELDDKGFVVTGRRKSGTPCNCPFETTEPGIFAVGDVRALSVKRVASAVGEGSIVVQWIHKYLEEKSREVSDERAA
jgi:thioredoxin reductase (NADPH)